MPPSRAQTRASYDRLSRWYDLLAGQPERSLRDLGLAELKVREGERVLEIGCGTGAALVELARAAGPAGTAVGADLSLGMCGIARSRIEVPVRSTVICADAVRLPVAQGAFDAVFMSFALELFDEEEIRSVLAECRRVLRPAGRLCVVAMAEPIHPNPMTRLYAWAHHHFPVAVDCRPIAVSQVLAEGRLRIQHIERRSLWGLPVEVALTHVEGAGTQRTP